MKEEKTKSKRKLIYYLVLAVSVLLLIAATVLTVYFVTAEPDSTLSLPPVVDDGPDEPADKEPEGPSEPSGGETVRFIAPVESTAYSEYAAIYNNRVLRWYYRHKAIDFTADEGADVVAICDGVVETIYERPETGNYVVIDHGNRLKSVYRFVEIDKTLRVGDTVKQGDKIGTVAAAYGIEKADGTHLHLEMKQDGKYVNPFDYIDAVFDEK